MPKPGVARKPAGNPFDSDSESESEPRHARTSSDPNISKGGPKPGSRDRSRNEFQDSGGLENQSVQVLEKYAVNKAKETTQKVNDCLKIAEVIKEDATRTLVTLHHQGEQIIRTHEMAVDMDKDLSRGEKLLGSLGGFFSKPWKPKRAHQIKGPAITRDDSFIRKSSHIEQRERLALTSNPQSKPQEFSEPSSALEKVQVEKMKQDDTLSDLSNILGDLKGMALDMGGEIERQNAALDHLNIDVEELNQRVKQANQRGRRLIGK